MILVFLLFVLSHHLKFHDSTQTSIIIKCVMFFKFMGVHMSSIRFCFFCCLYFFGLAGLSEQKIWTVGSHDLFHQREERIKHFILKKLHNDKASLAVDENFVRIFI